VICRSMLRLVRGNEKSTTAHLLFCLCCRAVVWWMDGGGGGKGEKKEGECMAEGLHRSSFPTTLVPFFTLT